MLVVLDNAGGAECSESIESVSGSKGNGEGIKLTAMN